LPSVQFIIETAAGDSVQRDGGCFGSYDGYLNKAQYDRRGTDAPLVWWRTRYRVDPACVFYLHTSKQDRRTMMRAYHKLYESWMHPEYIWLERYRNGQPRGLWFTAAVPFYLVVNMCSILRMKEDMPSFMHHWEQLERVFRHKRYDPHPWTMYHMAVSLCGPSNGSNLDWVKNPKVIPGSNTGHMPYDSNWVSIDEVKWMQRWRWDNLFDSYLRVEHANSGGTQLVAAKTLRSQWREKREDGHVSYYGREAHFTGREDKFTQNWMTVEAQARDLVETKEPPKRERPTSPMAMLYAPKPVSVNTINLFDFIDEVIIPHQL
jgi:hypothetical protein